jgi:hypothetical protein
LPTPAHFEQASELVTEEMTGESIVCGPEIDRHVGALRAFVDAGYDEVYVNQIGPGQEAFFATYAKDVLPQLR